MIAHNGAWLLSVKLGLPVIGVSLLICIALAVAAVMFDDWGDGWTLAILPGLGALALIIGPTIGYWPYQGDYHRLQPATGVVESVDTRFLAASQYVVVTYQGGLIVRCDDSRCATVRPGQQLRLLCTKEFEYGAVNGWGCRWGQR